MCEVDLSVFLSCLFFLDRLSIHPLIEAGIHVTSLILKPTCEYVHTSTHTMLNILLMYMLVYTVILLLLCFANAAAVYHYNYLQLTSPYIFVLHYNDYNNLYILHY